MSLNDRLEAVFCHVWAMLPPVKSQAYLAAVGLDDIRTHGSYDPDTGAITLAKRLFVGATPQELPLYDIAGNSPPQRLPCIARATHTMCHELWHAIGRGTGHDLSQAWLRLSGWEEAPDNPANTGRYFEHRPGWKMGPSEWRYRLHGTYFTREYSSRSPFEDQADMCTHLTLGWSDYFSAPHPYRDNALAKVAYLRRTYWQERGTQAVQAAAQRLKHRMAHHL